MEDKNNFNEDIIINVESESDLGLSPGSQKTFESLIKGIEVIESGNEKAINVAEIETGKVLGEIDAPPEAYLKINNINKTLKEALLGKPPKGSKMKKFFLGVGMTMLTQIPSFGANTEDASDNVLVNENPIEMESSDENVTDSDPDGKNYDAGADFSETEPEKESKDTEPTDPESGIEGGKHDMEFKANFDMGSAEMTTETVERLSKGISDYIESFSVEDLEKIKNGEGVVSFAAGCSPDEVHGEQETLGKTYTNNLELAKIRADLVEELGRKFLAEKGILNPIVIIDIPNVEGLERGVSENNERFASMKVFELNNQNMAKNYDLIIVDPSGSMNDDRAEINKFKDLNAEIIDLDVKRDRGDTRELIYRSVYKAVHGAENGSKIIFITDEGDNSSFDFDKMKELREIAEIKNIDVTGVMINPDNPNEKINFDYLNMMHAMKDKGGSGGDIKTFNLVKRILDLRRNT